MSHSLPTDVHSLRRAVRSGRRMEFLFFWSHRSRPGAPIGKECLSQWYVAPFVVQGVRYRTAEHYMMAEKARYFGDEATLRQILSAPGPRAAKRLGRQVRQFSEEKWATVRRRIVVAASMAKFSQNPRLAAYLVSTGERVLVEASPRDRIWGIGLAADDERATDPLLWPGLNLLGFALMETRGAIVQEHSG